MAAAPNMQRQLEFANKAGIPWMVLFGCCSSLRRGGEGEGSGEQDGGGCRRRRPCRDASARARGASI